VVMVAERHKLVKRTAISHAGRCAITSMLAALKVLNYIVVNEWLHRSFRT